MKTAIVSGVGPLEGLGAQLCLRFASLGLHVLAAGRTESKLQAVVEAITTAGGSGQAVVADATSEADTQRLFDLAGDDLTLAIYNTGNNTPGRIADMSAEYFEKSWRVCCFGGFLFGRAAVHRFGNRGGTLIFTGASASLRGRENFGAFNSSKGALRNLAQAMAKEYGRDGEKIKKGLPEYAAKLGDEGMINIDGIVDGYVFLYQQPRQAWSFELDVRTSLEKW